MVSAGSRGSSNYTLVSLNCWRPTLKFWRPSIERQWCPISFGVFLGGVLGAPWETSFGSALGASWGYHSMSRLVLGASRVRLGHFMVGTLLAGRDFGSRLGSARVLFPLRSETGFPLGHHAFPWMGFHWWTPGLPGVMRRRSDGWKLYHRPSAGAPEINYGGPLGHPQGPSVIQIIPQSSWGLPLDDLWFYMATGPRPFSKPHPDVRGHPFPLTTPADHPQRANALVTLGRPTEGLARPSKPPGGGPISPVLLTVTR